MSRHSATVETGGWVLLVAAIFALIYFLFGGKSQAAVSAKVTSKYPQITPDMADKIISGQMTARAYTPGSGCDKGLGESIFDAGNGTYWCVTVNTPSMYDAPSNLVV